MASQNPNQRNFLYPQVIDSNPDAPSSLLNTNHSSSSQPSLYPSVDYNDLVENLFPEDTTAAGSPSAPPEVTEEVLFRIPGAILNLVDKDYSVELACGDFSVIRLRQGDNVVAVYARVADEIQWPLAKDAAAVKLDDSHYFFSFRVPKGSDPDEEEDVLSYGLTIASKGQERLVKDLDAVLENCSCFSVQSVSENAKKKGEALDGTVAREVSPKDMESGKKKEMMEERCAAYWTTLAPNVEDYSGKTAKMIAAGSGHVVKGILWCGDVTVDRLKWGNQVMKKRIAPGSHAEVSPQTLKRIKRVKRVTKMTEKVANGFLSGVVKVSGFFTSSVINSKAGKKFFSFLPGEVLLASLDGFSKVCDAVEVTGKNVMSTSSTVTTELVITDMENKLLKQQVKGLVLLVMLWVLHGLLLRLGRLSTLRVFLNLPPWPKLVLKLLLLNLSLKIPSNLCLDIFNTGLSILQSEAAAYGFSLPIFSLRKGRGTSIA